MDKESRSGALQLTIYFLIQIPPSISERVFSNKHRNKEEARKHQSSLHWLSNLVTSLLHSFPWCWRRVDYAASGKPKGREWNCHPTLDLSCFPHRWLPHPLRPVRCRFRPYTATATLRALTGDTSLEFNRLVPRRGYSLRQHTQRRPSRTAVSFRDCYECSATCQSNGWSLLHDFRDVRYIFLCVYHILRPLHMPYNRHLNIRIKDYLHQPIASPPISACH